MYLSHKYCYTTSSGTDAIKIALTELNSKKVIIPTYTCTDILKAVKESSCEYKIVDSDLELQIHVNSVIEYSKDYDTVIIPHMFGIRANVKDTAYRLNGWLAKKNLIDYVNEIKLKVSCV